MSNDAIIKVQSVSLKRNSNQLIILWGASEKMIPPRPENPSSLPEEDSRHWYDLEYAGWGIRKINIPDSPGTGVKEKKLIYLHPGGDFPYMDLYADTLQRISAESKMELKILDAHWETERFEKNVRKAIQLNPDMILLNPGQSGESTRWYRMINEAGIPVVGSNFLADRESHRYMLAWTGPDDWGQSRLLARHLADKMGKYGGYVILQHLEGTSSFYARTWGVITELSKYAPKMIFLAAAPGMDKNKAAIELHRWIKEFGDNLKGLFCADDSLSMTAVSRVLEETGRQDVVCVAAGSSETGLKLIQEGILAATAYQSPEVDAEIAFQTIVDWFEAVPIDPLRYLPKHIITENDAMEFLNISPKVGSVDLGELFRSIRNSDWQKSYHFFGDLYQRFLESRVLPIEHFQGICLEILMGIAHLIKEDGLSVEECLGSYDSMVKHLLKDMDASSVINWLNELAQQAISCKMEKINKLTPIQEIIEYIDQHVFEPISLKTLSYQFGISHSYLGQMFRKETGVKFNDYVNTVRVDKAKVLLRGNTVSIKTVAESLGYSNPDYFYKIFKKLTGQSAGSFVKGGTL
ncbi:MAG: hypothetical protein DRP70_04840 [Spirochaetes bacterium]|nr:MAG: hypothetical protein DRP60_10870 [Spirochaetota bacterium]RKX77890.1 MAG: hypothetical protein DRP49_01485 [Spirochaetota bacterium]RKX89083.1 MAG: hypothetical protein DRP70_04840 [Spirochaetota bacterium]RKX98217.1 MAG: hypothetical protein DRZ90_03610 [Spirochaetota bacterium]